MHDPRRYEKGSSLVAGLMLTALLSSLLAGYYFLTTVELTTTEHSMNRTRGFYSAEAGLNLRAEEIRLEFLGYNRPTGTTPVVTAGQLPCVADQGAGDFRCIEYPLQGRRVATYVTEEPGNPKIIVVPPGEPYQNLNALEYKYTVSAVSIGEGEKPEAILELSFRSRVVPMFQFAAFYNKDLEITPGPFMTLSGPVHSNGDIYAAGSDGVDVLGDMTMSGVLFQGKKEGNICRKGDFNVLDPGALRPLPTCSGGRKLITQAELAPWNGHVMTGVEPVVVPAPDALDPVAGQSYWDNADIRIMYDTQTGSIDAMTPAGGVHGANGLLGTSAACSGALSRTSSFYNNREKEYIEMLEVDLTQFLDCVNANPALLGGADLDDTTHGGLVFYLGVTGPKANGVNDYGVRVRNGQEIAASTAGAPKVKGLTVVTNQAMYIQGHYNSVQKKPAAFLADSMNVLSTAWTNDSDSTRDLYDSRRTASPTTINAAFLAGTDTTGEIEGPAGQDKGLYSGGLHNFKRMHENWYNKTLTYRGSLVSLNVGRHVDGKLIVGRPQYSPPKRDFNYETDFNDMAKLPPLSPQFVYLKMDLFTRDYGL